MATSDPHAIGGAPRDQRVPGQQRGRALQDHRRTQGTGGQDELAFSLLGTETVDPVSKRKLSDAYLVLTQAIPDHDGETPGAFRGNPEGRVVNWISSQSVPAPLPPRSAGATRSDMMSMLERGHQGVKLSREEIEKLACWIDLLVPYCGDYLEANAWDAEELRKYEHFATKRLRMQEIEQDNLRDLLAGKDPSRRPGPMRGLKG